MALLLFHLGLSLIPLLASDRIAASDDCINHKTTAFIWGECSRPSPLLRLLTKCSSCSQPPPPPRQLSPLLLQHQALPPPLNRRKTANHSKLAVAKGAIPCPLHPLPPLLPPLQSLPLWLRQLLFHLRRHLKGGPRPLLLQLLQLLQLRLPLQRVVLLCPTPPPSLSPFRHLTL